MAELTSLKLNAEQHLLLVRKIPGHTPTIKDQPLLRLPYELARKNFKTAQRHVEKGSTDITASLSQATANAAAGASAEQTLASLDAMLARAQTLKRKLEALQSEEQSIHRAQRARVQHLQDLHEIPSLADVKYDQWSKIRLDRMLVDHLLRQGYTESAQQLAKEKGIEDLVDVAEFIECGRIEDSLRRGETKECLAWCSENKQALKKLDSNLELELRLQQFVELVRPGDMNKFIEAAMHARKYLGTQNDTEYGMRAGGLLANPVYTHVEPYKSMYASSRWHFLASLFRRTHHDIYSLPPRPLLHIALSAGLSALKTPSCHSAFASSSSNSSSTSTSVCPICSTELNELARNVPYAHHSKSYVENDPVVLPNGRVYGRERLMLLNAKIGTTEGKIRDPMDLGGDEFDQAEIKKVFVM